MTPAVMRALVEAVCADPDGGRVELRWWAAARGFDVERWVYVELRCERPGADPSAWYARVDGPYEGAASPHATRADAEAWLRAEVARLWPEAGRG